MAKTAADRARAVAKAFSDNADITVKIGQGGAFYDPKNDEITIPLYANWLKGRELAIEGLIDHETAHAEEEMLTRRSGGRTTLQIMEAAKGAEALFLNAFEDARIERDRCNAYQGMRRNLNALAKASVGIADDKERDPLWEIAITIYSEIRGIYLGKWCSDEFKAGVQDTFGDLIAKGKDTTELDSCEASLAFAKEAVARLKEIQKEQEQEQSKSDSGEGKAEDREEGEGEGKGKGGESEGSEDDKEEGTDGDPTDEGADDEAGEDAEGEDANGEAEGDGEEADEESEGESEGAPSDSSENTGTPLDVKGIDLDAPPKVEDTHAPLKEALEEEASEVDFSDGGIWRGDPVQEITGRNESLTYEQLVQARSAARTTAARLSRLLKASTVSRRNYDQEQGHLDSGSLYRLRTGNKRIFSGVTKGEAIDTVVTLLVDESGSMCESASHTYGERTARFQVATVASFALATVLDRIGIPFRVVGFDTGYYKESGASGIATPKTTVLKDFSDRLNKKGEGMATTYGNDNADGVSVRYEMEKLLERKESRKILVVFSDGKPAIRGVDGNELRNLLKNAIDSCEEKGVDTIGIGIGSASVKSFYPHYRVVNDLEGDNLSKALLEVFEDRLLANRSGRVSRVA